jgi:glycosyltransferase involved in cell wall biosynthesis
VTRVLHVAWRLARGGGTPLVLRRLLQGVERARFDVHVCTVRPLFAEDRVEELGEGLSFHPLGLEGAPTPRRRAAALAGVARVAWRVRPDVLHAHSGVASYALPALVARPPRRILEVQDAPQSGRISSAHAALEGFMARRLGFEPLVHSRSVERDLADAWRVSSHRFPLGIDVERFAPPPGGRSGEPVVLWVGRLVPSKRPDALARVASLVRAARPDAVVLAAGTGEWPGGLGPDVRALGFVEDLPGLYHSADVVLSTSEYEGFGLTLAEAMAAGVPVVSTRVGGVEDVVEDGVTGILAPLGDEDAMAEAILSLLADGERRRAMGEAGRARATSPHDARAKVAAYERLYAGG